jgi:hypothetical protein
MSLIKTIETDAGKIFHALATIGAKAEGDIAKAGPVIQAAAVASLQAIVTAAQGAEAAAGADFISLPLDATLLTDVKGVIAQFGDDLKALGIKL